MAHNKVARRSMSELEWIEIRCRKIKDTIIEKRVVIKDWKIREGRQIGEVEYEYFSKEYKNIEDGDYYFTPDGSIFLKNQIKLNEILENEEVWFLFKTAAEMIIKIDDEWAGGIDPNRNLVLIKNKDESKKEFKIEVEGYNRSKPDDERNLETSFLRGCRQIFNGGELVTINKEVEALYYDIKILVDMTYSEYVSDSFKEYIVKELSVALNMTNFMDPLFSKNKDLIKKIRDYIKLKIYQHKAYGKHGQVALISHSHLDIAYYWRKIHTIQKNARTCLIQLKLMEEYPEFKYSHSQAYTYEILEKFYPKIFQQVKEKIEEGSFEIVGGMYIEPDCNIPSAESLIRQCMYGQHYFREKFNKTINNCWLPDVFGNSWILPQILKKSEMKFFVSNKMSTWNDTNKFPHNSFKWKGIDGSEVLASVPPTHFIGWNTPEQVSENWDEFQDKNSCEESLSMFGYGDGGSGATRDMIEYMKRLEELPETPNIRHTTASDYLKTNLDNNEELDVWDGELYLEMHRGTFTTKGSLKRSNRELEIMLKDCELLYSYLSLQGITYPTKKINSLWKSLLVNQFHDIITGTHITPVGKDAVKEYEKIRKDLKLLIDQGIKHFKSEKKEGYISLLNTLSHKRDGAVFLEGEFSLRTKIPGYKVQLGEKKENKGIWIDKLAIKPMSAKVLEVIDGGQREIIHEENKWYKYNESSNLLETPHYSLSFNEDGSVCSLREKTYDREIVKDGEALNKLRVYHDFPGMYDAWDILESYDQKEDLINIKNSIKMIEDGPVYISFQAILEVRNSTFIKKIRLYKNSNKIDFEFNVNWYEKNRLAKLDFNLNLLSRYAKCDTSAGIISRETHKNTSWQKAKFEVVGHKWVELSESDFGIGIINDCKYGYSFKEDKIEISLLKGSIRPDPHSDEGEHSFSFSLIPHNGIVEKSIIPQESWAFNTPLIIEHDRSLDFKFLNLDLGEKNVQIQSIKKAEYSEEIIVRIVEVNGTRGKTILKSEFEVKEIKEINLLEDEIESNTTKVIDEKEIEIEYKPFEIKSFKINFIKVA